MARVQTKENPQGVLFIDFNGVISYQPFWVSMSRSDHPLHPHYEAIEQYLFRSRNGIVDDWMRGFYTSEQIHDMLEQRLGIPRAEVFKIFVEDCVTLDVSPRIVERVATLDRFHRVLRTDNMDTLHRWTLPAHPEVERSFDQIHCSFELRELKNDNGGQYFVQTAARVGVSIRQCIMVDDSRSTCQLFESLGGFAFNTITEGDVLRVLNELVT
jgi:beta-phosphoglucomutase-like phosphatase (HAD superfamily)